MIKWLSRIFGQKDGDEDSLKFIWGIKSWDDMSEGEASLYTMNDLDLIYDKGRDLYYLGLETIYHFDNGNEGEIKYLERLLEKFTEFVKESGYQLPREVELKWLDTSEQFVADTIIELYMKFYMFVKGYKALCEDGSLCFEIKPCVISIEQ